MRLALMTSGNYPCVRAGKMTLGMRCHGWEHDAIASSPPFQLERAYRRVVHDPHMDVSRYLRLVAEHEGELVHVHNEPNWPVPAIKETCGKPVIYDVHDVTSVRPDSVMDCTEETAFALADGFVFVSEEQRAACEAYGLDVQGRPYAIVPNLASSETFIDKTPLPHLGGLVYAGGVQRRGEANAWRDLSRVADVCEAAGVPFHIYPGNPGVDYGIVHPTVLEYDHLMHAIARHDWGFTGSAEPIAQWLMSVPNKVFEYFAAGVPVIALNNPLIKPFCDQGMGVYVERVADVPEVVRSVDPRPYRKAVLAQRGRYTMEKACGVLAGLYDEVLSCWKA